jgi:hypothetical protein
LRPPDFTGLGAGRREAEAERMKTVEQGQLPMGNCFDLSRAAWLLDGGLVADDLVPLSHGSDTDQPFAIGGVLIQPNDFPDGPDRHFSAASDFGGKGQSEIQVGASAEIVLDSEIDITSGNVTCLSVS